MPNTQELILSELRDLRADYNVSARETGERLSALEAQVKTGITGNGQPSRLQRIEESVSRLQAWRVYVIGAAAGVSILVSCLAWLLTQGQR
jgi:hypothetical protein